MKNDDDYFFFRGARLNKKQATRVGISSVLGFIGIILTYLLPIKEKSIISYFIITVFVLVGYFLIGNKIIKK